MDTNKETKNLYEKLLCIMEGMGTIEKKGYNDFSKYSYVRETDVAEKLQQLLIRHKVFITASVEKAESREVMSSKGKPNTFSSVHMKYTFVNAENPQESFEVYGYGEGMDTGDKAIYKAITGAHKYMILKSFNLGSEEDAEVESPERGVAQPQQAPRNNTQPVQKQDAFF